MVLEGLQSQAKSLEPKGHKWDVAMVQLGPDVLEFVPCLGSAKQRKEVAFRRGEHTP